MHAVRQASPRLSSCLLRGDCRALLLQAEVPSTSGFGVCRPLAFELADDHAVASGIYLLPSSSMAVTLPAQRRCGWWPICEPKTTACNRRRQDLQSTLAWRSDLYPKALEIVPVTDFFGAARLVCVHHILVHLHAAWQQGGAAAIAGLTSRQTSVNRRKSIALHVLLARIVNFCIWFGKRLVGCWRTLANQAVLKLSALRFHLRSPAQLHRSLLTGLRTLRHSSAGRGKLQQAGGQRKQP